MATENNITVTEKDFERLSQLVLHTVNQTSDLLEELSRAQVVPIAEAPSDIVTMNSTVLFVDLETKKETELTLVYPEDANLEKKKVSILAPVGTALLGLRVGQSIDWTMPNGKVRRLQVLSIVASVEAEESTQGDSSTEGDLAKA